MASRILAGRYDLKEKIGEGGMSVVFRAHDMVLNRFVAVKILRPEYTKDEHFINSFKRESQLAASIVDPNIVNVYDVGREGNIYYIVMELVEGMPLSDIIRTEGALDPRRAANIARQIAMALATAHRHHLIHRDVKPHNVLISEDDVAKIADFGIAKEVSNDTLVGEQKEAVMGSIHYFSPEQARGNGVDERSDIYSLGIVLYEMVTGQVPFDGETAVEVAVKHISEPMIPPTKINPSIPQDIEDIIMKASAKNPDDRYNNADEMITDLSFIKFSKSSNYSQELEGKSSDTTDKPDINKIFDSSDAENAKKKSKSALAAEKKKAKLFKLIAIVVAIALAIPLSALIYNSIFNPKHEVADIPLPSFVGMTVDEANESAARYNLVLEIELEVNSDEYDEGIIVSHTPSADATVKEGSSVKLVVSKGLNEGVVPSVVGKSQTNQRPNAKTIIESYHYVLGKITYQPSESVPEGYVVSQNPEKGTKAVAGTKINIVISSGPESQSEDPDNPDNPDNPNNPDNPDTPDNPVSPPADGSTKIEIPSGTAPAKIGEILERNGLCSSSDFVSKAVELKLDVKLKAGTYTIPNNASVEEIVKIISHTK